MKKTYTLQELASLLEAKVHGDGKHVITGIAPLSLANPEQITFLDNPKYHPELLKTKAGAVILAEKYVADCPTHALITPQPYVAYAKAAQLFWQKPDVVLGIHPTAVIDPSAKIGRHVSVGPFVVIGRKVILEDHAIIGAQCVISDDCVIGEKTELAARVTLYHHVRIGKYCMIHSGAVIGSDGFGFAPGKSGYEKIPQLGGVVIEDHVEIGANTTIDRGALNDTFIAKGVKLDNQIQIGHNVKIGENTVIAGCAGIAGSAEIGKNCMIGGGAGVAGHIKIGDHVMLTGMAMATHSLPEPGVYASGTGILPRKEWQKCVVRFRQLNELAKKILKAPL